jgi:hypothetical protein
MALEIDFTERGKEFMTNMAVMFLIAVSGLIMAITFFIMKTLETSFKSVDCLIPQNVFFTTCQEWFEMALYPVLELRSVLVYANYFFIFGVVFGLFYMGFRTKKHPALFVVHVISSIIIGYLAIEIGNIFRLLISNPFLYEMMIPFPIYTKIMLYLPQFIFFVIFLSGIIGFIGVFKSAGQYKQGNEDLG